ncbi:MAG TPA: redoxin domain-containing protein [bacterium]|jgi:predicted transcriptional regulator
MNALAVLVVCIMLVGVAAPDLSVGTPAPPFDLKDQFDHAWRLADLKGRVVVLMAADQHSGQQMRPWGDNLSPAYGGKIQLLGLLDLHTYPRFLRGVVAATIRSETDKPMMLDFEGAIGSAYEVSSRYPVVVVIDRQGIVRGVYKTTFTKDAFAAAREAIDMAVKAE